MRLITTLTECLSKITLIEICVRSVSSLSVEDFLDSLVLIERFHYDKPIDTLTNMSKELAKRSLSPFREFLLVFIASGECIRFVN